MKITYEYKPSYSFAPYWIVDAEFCCAEMEEVYDECCLFFNGVPGKVTLSKNEDRSQHIPINFCPFCGILIQLVQIGAKIE